MFLWKSIQFCSRLLDPHHIRASATLSQNVKFCSQIDNTTREETKEHTAETGVLAENGQKAPLTPKDILEKRAQLWLDNLDEKGLATMEKLKMMIELMRIENHKIPDTLSTSNWKVMIEDLSSTAARMKYMRKLYLDQLKEENRERRKLIKRQEQEEERLKNPINDYHQVSVHVPRRDVEFKEWMAIQGIRSDVNIVYDLDFKLSFREKVNVYTQMGNVWNINLNHPQPAHIHLTSIDENERLKDTLHCARKPAATVHKESVFDIFDREELVYLTPDGPPMLDFNPHRTYIVGALVDLDGRPRESFGKARAHGVRTAALPLHRYLDFRYSNRAKYVLNLLMVHSILLDMFLHHSWEVALRNNLDRRWVFKEDLKDPEYIEQRKTMIEKSSYRSFVRKQKKLQRMQTISS